MAVTDRKYPLDVLHRLADEVFERSIRSQLTPEDNGKFLAIDVDSGNYEIDADDAAAVFRLRSRCPEAEIWIRGTDRSAAYRIGRRP